MRKVTYIIIILMVLALWPKAQNAPPSKASDKPVPVEAKKEKPVVLAKQQLLELDNLGLRLQNAQLRAEAAIPAELKAEVKTANDNIDKFWAAVGVNCRG